MVYSSSPSPTPSYDFLISYASTDRAWAEWISYVLEENNYTVSLLAWDIQSGQNIILERDLAIKQTKHVLALLSQDYMKDEDRIGDWTTVLKRDPSGRNRSLIPVLIREYSAEGFISTLKPIILTNMDEEAMEKELISGVQQGRAKPSTRPAFPGGALQTPSSISHTEYIQKPPFPREYAPITRAIRAFIICAKAKRDQDLLEQFLNSLSLLQNKGIIQAWNSNNLLAGSHRMNEITKQIQQADIIMPLISSDFFSDSECTELAKASFASCQLHDARILPILLRPCMWKESEYRALTVLPDNQVELTKWSDRDEGLLNIASGIKAVVDSLVLKKDS